MNTRILIMMITGVFLANQVIAKDLEQELVKAVSERKVAQEAWTKWRRDGANRAKITESQASRITDLKKMKPDPEGTRLENAWKAALDKEHAIKSKIKAQKSKARVVAAKQARENKIADGKIKQFCGQIAEKFVSQTILKQNMGKPKSVEETGSMKEAWTMEDGSVFNYRFGSLQSVELSDDMKQKCGVQ